MALQEYQKFSAMSEEDRMQMAKQMREDKKDMIMMGTAKISKNVDESIVEMSK